MTVTSDLTVPTVLTNGPEDCDYYFPAGDITNYRVSSELVIEPGVVLRFGANTMLFVVDQGSITAVGESGSRITLEGEKALDGYWYGICFEENRESRLEYVDVRWGGGQWAPSGTACRGGVAGMYPGGDAVHITNSTITGSYVSGLNVHDMTLGEFEHNAFFGNREYGVNVHASQVRTLDTASDYLGSDSGAINGEPYVYAAGHISDAGANHVWNDLNAPYFASDDEPDYDDSITVADGTYLIITAGTTMLFEGDSELYVYGGSGLGIAGTADDPVLLAGINETRGSWKGVTISNSAAILENVAILWGGRDDIYAGSLAFVEIGTDARGKELRGVHIDGSANCALRIWHDDRSVFDPLDVTYGEDNEKNSCLADGTEE